MKKLIFTLILSGLLPFALRAQIIHVPADYPTIQQGINAANPGDTVLVADRTYFEQINFLGKKPLMVASQFIIDDNESHISSTIIDGSLAPNPDSASVVYFISGEDSTSVLCGFTITGGKGTYFPVFPDLEAGGILVWNCGAKIRNNIITGNTLDDSDFPESVGVYGAAACCYSYDLFGPYAENWIVFENNEISGNTVTTGHLYAHGGGLACIGNIIIRQNTIEGNSSIQTNGTTESWVGSGGLLCEGELYPLSEIRIQYNKIRNNTISAVNPDVTSSFGAGAIFKSVKLTCSGNEFTGNKITDPTIWGGGGMNCDALALGSVISGNTYRDNESTNYAGGLFVGWSHGYLKVENNYFFNNSAERGGAFVSYYSTLKLQNNVFYHNYAGTSGGGAYLVAEDAGSYHTACLINNTFNENKAKYAGALNVNNVNALVLNSIFYQDSAKIESREINVNFPTFEIAYSNIDSSYINYVEDYIYGEGNINMAPIFADDTLLTLTGLSPCINAGIDEVTCHGATWEAPLYDIDNLLRPDPDGELFDMGAHEFGSIGIGMEEPAVGSRQSSVVSCYPNPTKGMVDFRFSIFDFRWVSLKIYDLQGREVAVVLDGKWSGDQVVRWDATGLPAGVYFYELRAKGLGQREVGKIIKY